MDGVPFLFTPEEAQPIAHRLIQNLEDQGLTCEIEKKVSDDAPFTPTLTAVKSSKHPVKFFEVQSNVHFSSSLRSLNGWLKSEHFYGSLTVCTNDEANIPASTLQQLKRDGVGLVIINGDSSIVATLAAAVPALQIHLDPTMSVGRKKAKVKELVVQFNTVDRKAALRDLCELAEGETKKLVDDAFRKGRLTVSAAQITAMDWSSQINVLASVNQCSSAGVVIDSKLKDDLQSFRGARNLVDHPVDTEAKALKRERQFPERMLMGARLLGEIESARRRL